MLRRMSSREFNEWRYYSDIEPFDETREDVRNAHIVAALWNIARDTKKHPEAFKLKDFLLKFDAEAKAPGRTQSIETQIMVLKAIAAAHRTPRKKRR